MSREEGLKKKDLELQESLIRFSKFLQENDSKKTRAEKKAAVCSCKCLFIEKMKMLTFLYF